MRESERDGRARVKREMSTATRERERGDDIDVATRERPCRQERDVRERDADER